MPGAHLPVESAIAAHKTPAESIGDMVRREIALERQAPLRHMERLSVINDTVAWDMAVP
jgi:hypothetical protein